MKKENRAEAESIKSEVEDLGKEFSKLLEKSLPKELSKDFGKEFSKVLEKGLSKILEKSMKKSMVSMNPIIFSAFCLGLVVLGFGIRPFFDPYLKGVGITAQLAKIDPDLKVFGTWVGKVQEDSETGDRGPDSDSEENNEFLPVQVYIKK